MAYSRLWCACSVSLLVLCCGLTRNVAGSPNAPDLAPMPEPAGETDYDRCLALLTSNAQICSAEYDTIGLADYVDTGSSPDVEQMAGAISNLKANAQPGKGWVSRDLGRSALAGVVFALSTIAGHQG